MEKTISVDSIKADINKTLAERQAAICRTGAESIILIPSTREKIIKMIKEHSLIKNNPLLNKLAKKTYNFVLNKLYKGN